MKASGVTQCLGLAVAFDVLVDVVARAAIIGLNNCPVSTECCLKKKSSVDSATVNLLVNQWRQM